MTNYVIRFDDASDYWDAEKWARCHSLCVEYSIFPIIAIIPKCEDPVLRKYPKDELAWKKMKLWIEQGWTPALHGYQHIYTTVDGGINPVHQRSEFAGEPLEEQRAKIRKGLIALKEKGINPKLFVAPSHTFDNNTLFALRAESEIRAISDTIANGAYRYNDFVFLPQQSGSVREIKLRLVTFCYHPNMMQEKDFEKLEEFFRKHKAQFISFETAISKDVRNRKRLFDKALSWVYFFKRKLFQKGL